MPKSTVNIEFNLRGGGNLSEIEGSSFLKCLKIFANHCFKPIVRILTSCHSEFKLGCSHLTAIPSFACKILSCRKSSPASARNPLSESEQHEVCFESQRPQTLKRVQGDMYSGSFAFTLAETLITIGMIGVIAALTLPTLMNSTNEKEIVARVKKEYANFNEAFGRAVAKYGPAGTWINSGDSTQALKGQRVAKRILEFMQVEKDCGLTGTDCFASSNFSTIVTAVGSTFSLNQNNMYSVILSDGTSAGFLDTNISGIINIWVDIDGPKKGRNTIGIDIFVFNVMTKDTNGGGFGTIDSYVIPTYGVDSGKYCRDGSMKSACAYWILNNDNADYINCEVTDANPTCN